MSRDPFFGAPLSPAERRLWASLALGGGRVRERRATSPFGAGSGGAGGPVTSAESQLPAWLLKRIAAGNAYPWLYPTSDFQSFDKYGSVALPAVGTSATIGDGILNDGNTLPFTVPKGYNGFIKTIAIEFVANASSNLWTPGVLPQELGFVISVNGVPAADYSNIAYSPGTIQSPTPVAGIPIKENNKVVVSVNNLTITADIQFVRARLQGYYYGAQLEPPNQAF